MKKTVVGLLAHVDAGKTTLSEAILYGAGAIRRLGRVDDRDAFLDTFELERARGITIFSKQAVFSMSDTEVTLMDTPGHVDFSAEMERTLQILDYAVLVINGADGIQGHTETLWRLLKRYQIPAVLFVNKMDQAGTDKERLMAELKDRLDEGCVDFGGWQADGGEWNPGTDERESFAENLAVCDEAVLETYLETGEIGREEIIRMTAGRKLFPVFFGSALKMKGIESFLRGLFEIVRAPEGSSSFGAKIYKISRDSQGNRLTHLKVTGGVLRVKDALIGEEKVNQIRIYSGSKYETVQEAQTGTVCAVTGLLSSAPGQGLGAEAASELPVLEPVLTYRILLPEGTDVHKSLRDLRQRVEAGPSLLLH
uniref:GTP-binding protein n=1 Tax=Enterocloster sp. TaxID=2719315 RepID=UPI003A90E6A6